VNIEREEKAMLRHRWLLMSVGIASLSLSVGAAAQSSPVRPLENPGTWLHAEEIPAAARKETGSVAITVTVAPSGKASGCAIAKSSSVPILDETACAMVTRHGSFEPARDASGEAVAATYTIAGIRFTPD
jgi:TonB family protein